MSTPAAITMLPEDFIAQQGIPQLPLALGDDDEAQIAIGCVRDLVTYFVPVDPSFSADRRAAIGHATRRKVAPAIFVLLTYLMERTFLHYDAHKEDMNAKAFIFAVQQILRSFLANNALKEYYKKYSDEIPGPVDATRIPTTAPCLPQLKAVVSDSVWSMGFRQKEMIKDAPAYAARLELAILQWQAVRLLLKWKTERAKPVYLIVQLSHVRGHIAWLETELVRIKHEISELEALP